MKSTLEKRMDNDVIEVLPAVCITKDEGKPIPSKVKRALLSAQVLAESLKGTVFESQAKRVLASIENALKENGNDG